MNARQALYAILKMSVSRASTIVGLACGAISVVLAMGHGNQPAVRVWTAKTVQFCFVPIHIPDALLIGGPILYHYPSTSRFCSVRLHTSVPIHSSGFRVFLFMVAFRYVTAICKILNLVRHCHFLIYWLPL